MLAIRLQRTGRKRHAQYRMVVQDARKSPTSGKIITSLGNYNPHTKLVNIDKEKAGRFLSNGAQPSLRVVSLLAREGVAIPDWAKKLVKKERSIKNVDKLRKNRPVVAEAVTDEPSEEVVAEAEAPETSEIEPVAEGSATEEAVPEAEAETIAEEPTPEA